MNLQFISDSTVETTETNISVPGWHKDLVRHRLNDYAENPHQGLDFDAAMDDIEEKL